MKKSIRSAYIVAMGNGLESFIFREIEETIKHGIDITLFATTYKSGDIFSPKNEWKFEVISYLKIINAFLYYLILHPIKTCSIIIESIRFKSVAELLIAFDYSLRMKKLQINHIHCTFGDRKFFIGSYCKKLLNIDISVTIHAHEIYVNPNQRFFNKCIVEADKVVAISDHNKNTLINDFKVSPKKIKTIKLSVDSDNFKKNNKTKILMVSRFEERKGFEELLDALNILKRNDIEVIIVGFGDLDLKKMITERNLNNQVTVFDKMNPQQLKFFYNNSDIFCLPSKHTVDGGSEGIPVVLMEAMASEMIVVTTPNGSISELVDNILVKENDAIDLANGITKAIELHQSAAKSGSLNRSKILSEFSSLNIKTLNEYLYEDLNF